MRLFCALVWEELKPELSSGEIEDWVARMVPPDPEGAPQSKVIENYYREYGSLIYNKSQHGRKKRAKPADLQALYSDVGDEREHEE
jgi:hypothetical protein